MHPFFVCSTTLLLALLAAPASATGGDPTSLVPGPAPQPQPQPQSVSLNNCNVANQMCCNQTQDYDAVTKSLIGLFGLNAQGFNGQIGVSCSPLQLDGDSGSTCQANPVCCTGDSANGLFALDCSPLEAPLIDLGDFGGPA